MTTQLRDVAGYAPLLWTIYGLAVIVVLVALVITVDLIRKRANVRRVNRALNRRDPPEDDR